MNPPTLLPSDLVVWPWEVIEDEYSPIQQVDKRVFRSAQSNVILKIVDAEKADNEIRVSNFLNNLATKTTVFSHTYGHILSNSLPPTVKPFALTYCYIVMDNIDYAFKDLEDEPDKNEFFFWSILIGLYHARKEAPFNHHDIHTGNLMFNRLVTSESKTYIIENDFPVQFNNVTIEPKLVDYGKSVLVHDKKKDWRNYKRIWDSSDVYHLSRIFTERTINSAFRKFLKEEIEQVLTPYPREVGKDSGANYQMIVDLLRLYFANQPVQCSMCSVQPAKYKDPKAVYCSKECQIKFYQE